MMDDNEISIEINNATQDGDIIETRPRANSLRSYGNINATSTLENVINMPRINSFRLPPPIKADNNDSKTEASSDDLKKKIDYSGVMINYTKIDNLSPMWAIMLTMQENLNARIGTNKLKKYTTAAFWNYLTTPINFTITLFTALSAGQTGSSSTFLSNSQLFYILFISFILSTINTFFKLKEKAEVSFKSAKEYEKFGAEFDRIYFMPIMSNDHVMNRLGCYQVLQDKIDEFETKQNYDNSDFMADAIYCFIRTFFCCCINKKRLYQVSYNQRLWYLDGEYRSNGPKSYKLNVKKLFVYDYTNVKEPKSAFYLNRIMNDVSQKYNKKYNSDLNDDMYSVENFGDYKNNEVEVFNYNRKSHFLDDFENEIDSKQQNSNQ
jgi:hypothetical protein